MMQVGRRDSHVKNSPSEERCFLKIIIHGDRDSGRRGLGEMNGSQSQMRFTELENYRWLALVVSHIPVTR